MGRKLFRHADILFGVALVAMVLAAFGLLSGCDGGDGGGKSTNPAPTLTALSPTSAIAGGPAFTLTVTGSGYAAGFVVQWNGAERPTTFISDTQLSASIAAEDIASAGTAQVTVRNPALGGGTSSALTFAVNQPMPTLTELSPDAIAAGSPDLALIVSGSGFIAASVVRLNGQPLTTTFSTATELRATVPASRLLTLGDVPVSVFNPPPGGGESVSLPLHVGGNLRASVTHDGSDIDGGSDLSATSADGRFVAFASNASNLVAGDTNGTFDVFVRDTCLNTSIGCTPATQRVSLAQDGSQGNADSGWTVDAPELSVAISGTGRFVAFVSAASNLVPGDTNPSDDIFVRDTCIGAPASCTPTTTLASAGLGGTPANSRSTHVAVSRSGRFVAFISFADNLVAGDTNGAIDVFLRDTCTGAPTGCAPSTRRVSLNDAGLAADRDSLHPSFSGNERYVVFTSVATNLVGGDTNDAFDVFRWDTCYGAGAGCSASIARVSLTHDGSQSNGHCFFPKSSVTGRYIAFVSDAADFVPGDTNTVTDMFVRDTCLGAPAGCSPSTVVLSLGSTGLFAGGMWMPALSDDARYAAFASSDHRYVPNDTNNAWDVFLRDSCIGAPAGCVPSTRRVTVAFDGAEGNGGSQWPSLSADGRFVTYSSRASNLVPGGVSPTFYLNIYVAETGP